MHRYTFGNVSKNSKREFLVDKPRRSKSKSSRPNSAEPVILTSQKSENDGSSVPAASFYTAPKQKSVFELKYEEKISRFLGDSEISPKPETPEILLEENLEQILPPSDIGDNILSSEKLEEVLSPPEKPFQPQFLVAASEKLFSKAHSIVLYGNDVAGTKKYYFLIEQALKCIHMALDQFLAGMDPREIGKLNFRLAEKYFSETGNLDLADLYVGRALRLAIKHQDVGLRLGCDILSCRILEATNAANMEQILQEKADFYEKSDLAGVLRFALGGEFLVEPENPILKVLFCFQRAGDDIFLLSQFLKKAAKLLRTEETPQLKAMNHLWHYAYYVFSGDFRSARKCVSAITEFILDQENSGWLGWRQDGVIGVNVSTCPLAVLWLDPAEFSLVFHFYTALFYLFDRNNHHKADSALETAISVAETEISILTAKSTHRSFPLAQLTRKIVRLTYIKFLTLYYRVWLHFLQDNFSEMSFVREFIAAFGDDNFTAEELCYYKPLLPRFYYLAGVYYQSFGDLHAAKTFFMRARSGDKPNEEILRMQRHAGVACESQAGDVSLFATVHLVCLVEFELKRCSDNGRKAELRLHLSELHSELAALGKSKDPILRLTHLCIVAVAHNNGLSNVQDRLMKPEMEEILNSEIYLPPNLHLLALFLLFKLSLNIDHQNRYYGKATRRISKENNSARLLSIPVLQEAYLREEKKTTVNRKLQQLHASVSDKLAMAGFSAE